MLTVFYNNCYRCTSESSSGVGDVSSLDQQADDEMMSSTSSCAVNGNGDTISSQPCYGDSQLVDADNGLAQPVPCRVAVGDNDSDHVL